MPFYDIAVFYLANPENWYPVRSELHTLDPHKWLGGSCIEFYLLLHWLKTKDTSAVWYMTYAAVIACSQLEPPSEEDVNRTRDQLLWKYGDPMRPVSFMQYTRSHYFSVVFDYEKDVVYVFGRNINEDGVSVEGSSEWREWNGPHIWRNAAVIYGWEQPETSPGRIYYVNWPQVSRMFLERKG